MRYTDGLCRVAQIAALLFCITSLAGCYSPEIGACVVSCSEDIGECPEGTSCSDGFCNPPGVTGAECMAILDGGMGADASTTDGSIEVSLTGMVEIPNLGPFQMGCSPSDPNCPTTGAEANNEDPLHPVTLSTYWIDLTEVTAADYADCVKDGPCITPSSPFYLPVDNPRWPVTGLSRDMGRVYCEWLGKHLPTEAQWEKAARGDGAVNVYPWGPTTPQCMDFAHYKQAPSCNVSLPAEVDSYVAGASPYGLLHMSGNVWEWVSDSMGDYPSGAVTDPEATGEGLDGILRGGGFLTGLTDSMRASNRHPQDPLQSSSTYGVRCVHLP